MALFIFLAVATSLITFVTVRNAARHRFSHQTLGGKGRRPSGDAATPQRRCGYRRLEHVLFNPVHILRL